MLAYIHKNRAMLFRYLIAGILGGVADLGFLYVFTDIAGIDYLHSAIYAFVIAFFVSFTLQKFWTFADVSSKRIHFQLTVYLCVAIFNLFLNTVLMYVLVEHFHVWYMLAQIIAAGLIGINSFFIYRFFIFSDKNLTYSGEKKQKRLLVITQKVDRNDSVLGFMHGWILELARQTDQLTVICLYKGDFDFPKHVTVLSLGKEKRVSRLAYIFNFYRYIWNERKNYDWVFVHMNQIYVILGACVWYFLGKQIGLWYAHSKVSGSLRSAHILADVVFTSTESGFRVPSGKKQVVGQGIDTELFGFAARVADYPLKVIALGRISPIKDYETLISAITEVSRGGVRVTLDIVGGAGTLEQEAYVTELKKNIEEKGISDMVRWVGAIPNKDIVPYLQKADVFVNTSLTGSLDKAGLEAMSTGLILLTCNEAFQEVLSPFKEVSFFEKRDAAQLADRLRAVTQMSRERRDEISKKMREQIVRHHTASSLMKKILDVYSR